LFFRSNKRMSSQTVKWGIIGTGKIAHDVVTALSYVAGAQVIAVGSRSQESADKFGKDHNIQKCYSSYEAVAKDPEVQIIYISTLHPLHKENALVCIQHGKAVLCEKPLTVHAKDTQELVKLAREKNVLFVEGMWTRYFPAIEKVKQLIDTGTLGDIQFVVSDFGFRNTETPRLVDPKLGGGALLDIGIYVLSLASFAFGGQVPSKIKAIADLSDLGVDQQISISLGYKHGQIANLSCSFLTEMPIETIICGSKGRVRIHGRFYCPTKLTVTLEGKDEVLEFPLPKQKDGHYFNFPNSIGMQYQASYIQKLFIEGKKESDRIPLDETITIMNTLEEIKKQVTLNYS